MYLRPTTRKRIRKTGEVFVCLLAAFVTLASRIDGWPIVQQLIALIS
jgi:hypothetical protein